MDSLVQRMKKVGPILLVVGGIGYFVLGSNLAQFFLGLAVVGLVATIVGFIRK